MIVFVALTTYQLLVSDLYARFIRERYDFDKIIVISVGLETTNFDVEKKYELIVIPSLNGNRRYRILQRLVWGGHLFNFTNIYQIIKKSSNIHLFVFNDNEPITNKIIREVKKKSENNQVTVIEEGIGIYEESSIKGKSFSQTIRYLVTVILGSPMQYKAVGDNCLIDNAIVGDIELYSLLRKAKGQAVFSQSKSAIYDASVSFLDRYNLEHQDFSDFQVLYLGQPFSEYGELVEEEKKYIELLLSGISSKVSILIKPHPRDAKGKYLKFVRARRNLDIIVDEYAALPIECLLRYIPVKIVVSFNSSAGVNMAKTYRQVSSIFTYRLPLASKIYQLWNTGYTEQNEKVFKSKYNNIFIPSSDEEYAELANRLLHKRNNYIEKKLTENNFTEISSLLEGDV